jgi:putative transposase
MSISLAIKQNDIFVRQGKRISYLMETVADRMMFHSLDEVAEPWTPTEAQFVEALQQGEVKPYEVVRDAEGNVIKEGVAPFPPKETKKENDARSLFYYGKKWFEQGVSKYHLAIDAMVENLSKEKEVEELGLKWKPSAGAIHRLVIKYPTLPELTAQFCVSQRGANVRKRWHPVIAKKLEEVVDWYWAPSPVIYSKTDACVHFEKLFKEAVAALAADPVFQASAASKHPIHKPSNETVRAYIDSAECYETWRDKFGEPSADAKFKGNVHPIKCEKALQYVLIDSTIADAWCVLDDESLLPLGRPTVTIAIDLFTRVILAIIVTFEPPSIFTIMSTLKRINVPKDDVNLRWPGIFRKSDGWGKPDCIVVDNELAQSGRSAQLACEDARIRIKWAPVKRPQFKAVVERFFRTLNDLLFKKLPGGLPYKPPIMKALGIDPSEVSTITLETLTELINMTVNDIYHRDPHRTLRMPPALAWQKSIERHKRPYIGDLNFIDKAFGAVGTGTLTTSGIEFKGMTFHDPAITGSLLSELAHKTPHGARRKSLFSSATAQVMWKYNPVNMDAINVWSEKRIDYIRLPNAAGGAVVGLSLRHWQILRIWAEKESLAFSTPEQQAEARLRQLERIQEEFPEMAHRSIKNARRIIHNPAELIEGKATLHTTAAPTVGGMAEDNIEIDVRLNSPTGNRIPPKGPVRGKRRSRKPAARPQTLQAPAPTPAPSAAMNKLAANIAAFQTGAGAKPSK